MNMVRKEGSLLIVDDNPDLLIALKAFLSRHFAQIDTLRNPNLVLNALEKNHYDLVLLDMNFQAGIATGNEGLYWMHQIHERDPGIAVVFITAYGDVELAVKSMKEGATDFIMKSWDEQKILSTLLSAYQLKKSREEVHLLRKKQEHLQKELEGDLTVCRCQSAVMKKLEEMAMKVAATDASVLITGENGTGKELIARDIHRLSNRNKEIFVKVDLGAVPGTLFESELFGHTKGAFTDAGEERDGRFVIASGGTLFLDEIGNLPFPLQPKLLSAIQNREVYPVGSSTPVATDVRIISATNMGLHDMIIEKKFREDLFYRINGIHLEIPPLRERPEDIPLLVQFFLSKYGEQYRRGEVRLGNGVMEKLQQHDWPGNIRELDHSVEKAVILSEGEVITSKEFFPGPATLKSEGRPATLNLEENERRIIGKALRDQRGNVSAAARKLGINRSTLYQKMKKYGF